MTWRGDTYYGPMDNPDGIVTYLDLAQWARITLTEAEERFGAPGGPEPMRIAGADCFWVRDILRFLETTNAATTSTTIRSDISEVAPC